MFPNICIIYSDSPHLRCCSEALGNSHSPYAQADYLFEMIG